jgi:6-phosphofructokinase 1
MGYAAVEALIDDQKSIMVGFHNSELTHVPFRKVIKLKKKVDPEQMQMVEILSV